MYKFTHLYKFVKPDLNIEINIASYALVLQLDFIDDTKVTSRTSNHASPLHTLSVKLK